MARVQFHDDDIPSLSGRQHWVLALLATYRSYAEIADALSVSVNTAKKHASALYEKLGVTSRSEAVTRGIEMGLISAPVSVPLPFSDRLLIDLARRRRTFADAARATSKPRTSQMRNRRKFAPDVLA